MNERIKQLAEQAGFKVDWQHQDVQAIKMARFEKFAELIVRECATIIENRAPGQMGTEGEGWTNGYDDGLKTGAFLIKEHFEVEE